MRMTYVMTLVEQTWPLFSAVAGTTSMACSLAGALLMVYQLSKWCALQMCRYVLFKYVHVTAFIEQFCLENWNYRRNVV